jgi:hypothetical protein
MYGGQFRKTKLMSVPGVELVGKQHKGELTSEPPRRQATSPGRRSELGRQGGRPRRKERQDLAAPTRSKPRTEGFEQFPCDYGDMPPPLRHPLPRQTYRFLERGAG